MRFIKNIFNFIYSIKCTLCKASCDDFLCDKCYNKLQFIKDNYCINCGIVTSNLGVDKKCISCLTNKPFFNSSRSVAVYNECASQLLHMYKFHDQTYLAKHYAKLMIKFGEDILKEADCLVAVPIHYFRMLNRKYNQSNLIAMHIAKQMKIPFKDVNLVRIKNTIQQHKLSYNIRTVNVKNAFCLKNPKNIYNKNVVIIDDLMTTGATLNECAKILIKNGAKKVDCLVLFRAIKN